MAVLHLDNVPEDLVRRIEKLAERVRKTPEATVIQLLEEAVPGDLVGERKHCAGSTRTHSAKSHPAHTWHAR